MSSDDSVVLDWRTAEYLATLIGQTNWGDGDRRAEAGARLAQAMGRRRMSMSIECFAPERQTGKRKPDAKP